MDDSTGCRIFVVGGLLIVRDVLSKSTFNFGSVNQLPAGLALLVITVYLAHKKMSLVYTMIPMIFMLIMTGWAMVINIGKFFTSE